MAPNTLLSLVVGPLIDRWDRRWVMILSDSGAGLSTLAISLLLLLGRLELWPVLLATAVSSAFSALQWPAYAAATSLLVPREHLGRANGMVQLSRGLAFIASPALAGVLVANIGVTGVILIDFATFAFAVLTLLAVQIPKPQTCEGDSAGSTWLSDLLYGWSYLVARPGLLGLLLLFACLNFLLGLVMALFGPMVLAFADADTLGVMTSIAASGMLVGGALMGVWGGPRRRMTGVLGFLLLAGISLAATGLRPSPVWVTVAAFVFFFAFVAISACSDSLWQSKVGPGVQGRVFSTRSALATLTMVPAYALAGPLADQVVGPMLEAEGVLAGSIGPLIGVGPGRGIGLTFVLAGLLMVLAAAGAYTHPRVRMVEDELPDAVVREGEPTGMGLPDVAQEGGR
jgi:DHA3 family macrolide efflux protein-like MFS transporter